MHAIFRPTGDLQHHHLKKVTGEAILGARQNSNAGPSHLYKRPSALPPRQRLQQSPPPAQLAVYLGSSRSALAGRFVGKIIFTMLLIIHRVPAPFAQAKSIDRIAP